MATAPVKVKVETEGAQKAQSDLQGVSNGVLAVNQSLEIAKKAFDFLSGAFESMSAKYAASAKLDAVLKSTGGAAGMTRESLDGLTKQLTSTTLASGTMVREAEHMLLTFTQIGKDVFPQATETVLNMATAFGTDAKTAAVQLGKALNDPAQGMNALRRVGVSFSAEQKAQIKQMQQQGDLAGAQKVILKELSTEFGGLAKAMADTPTGRLEMFNKAIKEAKGFFIDLMLKGLSPFIDVLTKLGNGLRAGLAALGPFKGVLAAVAGAIGLMTGAVAAYSLASQLAIVKTTVLAFWHNATAVATAAHTAATWLLTVAMNANPIGILITLLGLLVGGTYLASKGTGSFAETMKKLWETIKTVAEWSFRLLTPIGQLYTIGQQLYERFPKVRAVFDAVWMSLKQMYEWATKAVTAVGDFLGLTQTDAEKAAAAQKKATADNAKALADGYESFKSMEEERTKNEQNNIKIRLANAKKDVLEKALLQEEARHQWAAKVAADKAGEEADAKEAHVKALEATRKMHDMDVSAAKDANAKKKALDDELAKAKIANIADEKERIRAQYEYDFQKLVENRGKGEKETELYYERVKTLKKKLDDDLAKTDKKDAAPDSIDKNRHRALAAHIAFLGKIADEQRAFRDRMAEFEIAALPTEFQRLDAKYAYERKAKQDAVDAGTMAQEEYYAWDARASKDLADSKRDMEIESVKTLSSTVGEIFNKETAVGKAAAIAQATINVREGATKAFAQGGIWGPIAGAAIIALGAIQIAKIAGVTTPKRRLGGIMSGGMYQVNEEGPEFAVNAGATARNRTLLESMNANAPVGKTYPAPATPQTQSSRSYVDISGKLVVKGGDLVYVIEKQMAVDAGRTL